MLLEKLSNEIGVSGDEGRIRKLIIPEIKANVAEISVDTMGNVYAHKTASGQADALTVMVTAHMDEVGFMITEVTDKGMLKFAAVGGFDARILLGKRVLIGQEKIPGVIGAEAIHNLSSAQRNQTIPLKSMRIDIGAASKSEATGKVSPGDYASFDTRYGRLNGDPNDETKGIVKGKALDNRVGCTMLIELLSKSYPLNLVGVFTVQEEIGLRGAHIAAHKVNPDLAIVLECTTADDLPVKDKEISYPRLGDGPCITVMDRSFIANRKLVDLFETTATRAGIPYQYKKPGLGGTDAGAIHLARAGIPSITIAPASRYIHSPAALLELADMWNGVKLIAAVLAELPPSWQKS